MKENQIKLLSLQETYTKDIENQIGEILNRCYSTIRNRQDKIFDEMSDDLDSATNRIYNRIYHATDDCNEAVSRAEGAINEISESCGNLYKINSVRNIISYITPTAVLLYLGIKIAQLFTGG